MKFFSLSLIALLMATKTFGKNIHVSKKGFIDEIKQHRGIYSNGETNFETWRSPEGNGYLIPNKKATDPVGYDYQLGYALQLKDEGLTESLIPVYETNVTALGFPKFWNKFEEPCEAEPRTITIILDSIEEETKASVKNSKEFIFFGLEDQDEIVTETVVKLVTVHSTTTVTRKGTGEAAKPTAKPAVKAGTESKPSITTAPQTITLGFGIDNETNSGYTNTSEWNTLETSISNYSTISNNTMMNEGFLERAVSNSILGAAILLGIGLMM
ncbi:hypothetical protein FOA43_002962 [Brettanomyces nanus]|uniref:Uncharacterized protein n=1 Tax=Eeniella nana TaxID=13502 RepID=A0A875S5H3_EENNA|nr:uncharacterized protein FOA43_002962 [Brettanomyces nanus]QPG75605.1 hypothetical protein FOA43_002962 [Brettanomyces nanus]